MPALIFSQSWISNKNPHFWTDTTYEFVDLIGFSFEVKVYGKILGIAE